MKRLQIYLEPAADDALAAEAARTGVSKAAIIRGLVAEHTGVGKAIDPVDALIGAFEGPVGDIDDIVYGRLRRGPREAEERVPLAAEPIEPVDERSEEHGR